MAKSVDIDPPSWRRNHKDTKGESQLTEFLSRLPDGYYFAKEYPLNAPQVGRLEDRKVFADFVLFHPVLGQAWVLEAKDYKPGTITGYGAERIFILPEKKRTDGSEPIAKKNPYRQVEDYKQKLKREFADGSAEILKKLDWGAGDVKVGSAVVWLNLREDDLRRFAVRPTRDQFTHSLFRPDQPLDRYFQNHLDRWLVGEEATKVAQDNRIVMPAIKEKAAMPDWRSRLCPPQKTSPTWPASAGGLAALAVCGIAFGLIHRSIYRPPRSSEHNLVTLKQSELRFKPTSNSVSEATLGQGVSVRLINRTNKDWSEVELTVPAYLPQAPLHARAVHGYILSKDLEPSAPR